MIFSLASCPTLLARVITVSIMLDQFSLPDRDHSQTEGNNSVYSTECLRMDSCARWETKTEVERGGSFKEVELSRLSLAKPA